MYSFANLLVNIKSRYEYVKVQCSDYECVADAPADIEVSVTEEEIRQELLRLRRGYSAGYAESVCAYGKLCMELPHFDAMLLHSSVISCGDRGIAFLAPRGTGKTTHTRLWSETYGDEVTVINGDKPIVRFFDGIPYAYGTPWAGKEKLSVNKRVKLTDLCFLERGKKNAVSTIPGNECVGRIMKQILIPVNPENAVKTLSLTDSLLKFCRMWRVTCNTENNAAVTAHEAIMKTGYME